MDTMSYTEIQTKGSTTTAQGIQEANEKEAKETRAKATGKWNTEKEKSAEGY